MKAAKTITLITALAVGMFAQTTATLAKTKTSAKKSAAATVTKADLDSIRQMMLQQQQQLQQMQQQMTQKDQQLSQTQQQLTELQNATIEAKNRAQAAEAAANQSNESATKLQSDVSDIKLNQQNSALSTQDDQKRVTTLEGVVNRFRFGGDARVRGESFFQSFAGCPAGVCEDRNRVRLRFRLGVEGKLNEDFTGGIYLATGIWNNGTVSFTDPISTNETATGFFEKKTIGLDRGWITYNPLNHKWLSLTGGKFAYNWQRTNYMFDPDLNPEGFSEKFSFDTNHTGILKNVTFQGMQLLFNEVSKGRDSYAAGGQFLMKVKPLNAWTITPSFTLLDWSRVDVIANAAFPLAVCKTAVTIGCLPQAVTTGVGSVVNPPTVAPIVTLANGVTNSTVVLGTGSKQTRGYAARFTNADLILDNLIATQWWNKRLPVHVLGEYENNLRDSVNNRNSMYVALAEIGQAKDKHDWLFGYTFNRTDQDAVISSFAESDQRSPTNVVQHKFYAGWMVAKNTQAVFTWWHGRVQDATLQNAPVFSKTLDPVSGAVLYDPAVNKDPYLNRLQLDLIYKF